MKSVHERKAFVLTIEALVSLLIAVALLSPAISMTRAKPSYSFLHDYQLVQDAAEVSYQLGVFQDLQENPTAAKIKLEKIASEARACIRLDLDGQEFFSSSLCKPGFSTRTIASRVFPTALGFSTAKFYLER